MYLRCLKCNGLSERATTIIIVMVVIDVVIGIEKVVVADREG